MKNPNILFITMLCLGFSVGFCSTQWPNEPAGSTNVFDCPFAGNVCGMQDVYKSTVFVTDPATPTGGTNQVVDNFLGVNSAYGNAQQVYYLQNNPREIYVGTWWKTNPEFQGNNNIANKLIFISGDAGNNNYLNWYGSSDAPRQLTWVNQSPQNNCHVSGWYGECADGTHQSTGSFKPNGVTNGVISAGSGWHRIEIYQKASSTGTSRDGIIRIWIDGVLSTNYTNVNLSPEGFGNVQYNHTWDGGYTCAVRDCSRAWHHYWDHLRVSVPNCGAGGCPAPAYLVITSTVSSARTGTPYSVTLAAEGGKQPYAWFHESGNLPNGLTLNQSTGVISGTPTCVGRSDFTIRVTDSNQPALTATKSYTIITSGTGTCTSGMEGSYESKVASRELESGVRVESRAGHVRFGLPQQGRYSLSVYDLSGREVWRGVGETGGRETMVGVPGALREGVYLVRLQQGPQSVSGKFVVAR